MTVNTIPTHNEYAVASTILHTRSNDMTCDGALTFWIYFFFILSVLLNEFRLISAGRPNELHIGGIFPIAGKGGWQGGQACMPAARLALDDVNKETNLLPGFRLILHSNDSECDNETILMCKFCNMTFGQSYPTTYAHADVYTNTPTQDNSRI
uniref:Receptor ligand binding region domain-containing protein n=1 Tax=Glossina austeni TaxID=7395 RepID=A0A1A9UIR9_GLOAU